MLITICLATIQSPRVRSGKVGDFDETVPWAGVKAWVDNLIRAGRTFGVGPQGLEPMATGKNLVVISTRGLGYGPDSPLAACDHLEGWFRDIFGFIGVSDCHFVQADNLDFAGPEAQTASMKRASEALNTWPTHWHNLPEWRGRTRLGGCSDPACCWACATAGPPPPDRGSSVSSSPRIERPVAWSLGKKSHPNR